MEKVKEFILKHKKLLIIILAIVLVVNLGVGGYFLFREKPSTLPLKIEEKKIENTYTMYVKINPLVKLTLKEVYTECIDEDGTKTICSEMVDSVVDYELINDDAKEVYNDLVFKDKAVLDVLVMLCDTARENDIGFEKLEITSDWKNIYNEEEINAALKESGKYEYEINVYVDFTEHPESSDILEEATKYTITFDSNGGTKVDSQEVLEKSKVTKPENPTKEGYTFVEWQLNKKTYDFNKEVTSDITLIAKWEKVELKEEPADKNQTSNENKEESSTTQEPEKEESTISSTINKINLNDNLLVYEWLGGGTICGGYFFATNAESVFGDILVDKTINHPDAEEKGIDLKALYNQLNYDTNAELAATDKLENIKSSKGFGYKNFRYWNIDHSFGYRFDRLELVENYGNLKKEWQQKQLAYEQVIHNVFDKAYLEITGYCGIGPENETLLTEELCTQYNLTCARW